MARLKPKQLKLSAAARQEFADLFEHFTKVPEGKNEKSQLRQWIEKVGRKNPGRAAELVLVMAEYVAPKLARVEQTGPDGGMIRVVVKTEGVPRRGTPAPEGES